MPPSDPSVQVAIAFQQTLSRQLACNSRAAGQKALSQAVAQSAKSAMRGNRLRARSAMISQTRTATGSASIMFSIASRRLLERRLTNGRPPLFFSRILLETLMELALVDDFVVFWTLRPLLFHLPGRHHKIVQMGKGLRRSHRRSAKSFASMTE